MDGEEFIQVLEQRWKHIFSSLHEGGDVAPSYRLHTEGMMMAAELLELASAEALQAAMAESYAAVYEEGLTQRWGETWRLLFPFPQIPAFSQRAPVFPSTSE